MGNRFVGCCNDCDAKLNAAALEIMRIPGRRQIMARYRRALEERQNG